jgi:hypothetical protein
MNGANAVLNEAMIVADTQRFSPTALLNFLFQDGIIAGKSIVEFVGSTKITPHQSVSQFYEQMCATTCFPSLTCFAVQFMFFSFPVG